MQALSDGLDLLASNRAFSHDVSTAAVLVLQITAAILAFQTNPVGVEHFSHVKNLFYSNTFSLMMDT